MLIVSERTSFQISKFNKLKLALYKALDPYLGKLNKLTTFLSFENLIIYFYLSIFLFGRSLTGVELFKFRLGELMIAGAMLMFFYHIFLKTERINNILGKKSVWIFRLIFIHFIGMNLFSGNLTNFFNTGVYRSSSYSWTLGFIFLLPFLSKTRIFDRNIFLTSMFIVLPLVYIFTCVYYPGFMESFFVNYSDKFRYLKGSDLFLVFSIYCIFFFERIKNNNFIYLFTFIISGLLLPLIIFSSRGASIGTMIVLLYAIYTNRKAFLRNKFLFILASVLFVITLTFSSIYLDWTKIDFEEINTEMALESLEMTLVSKRYPEYDKPILFIENLRLNSGDGNLNWRLQIWQDVMQDLSSKNLLIFGYGYENTIPAMERIDRVGLDGTNIHVHNYFINILARGGLYHLFLFLSFYIFLIQRIKNLELSKSASVFIIAVLFVSFFDSSMESVRFPFLFFSILSSKIKQE